MTVFTVILSRRGRYAASSLALAVFFGLTTLSAAILAFHLLHPSPRLLSLRAVFAAAAIPALYLHFDLASDPQRRWARGSFWHVAPLALAGAALVSGRLWLIDPVLLAVYVGYLVGLWRIHRRAQGHFAGLGRDIVPTVLWLRMSMAVLSVFFVLEIAIFFDLLRGGTLADSSALVLSMVILLALTSYALVGSLGRPCLFEHIYDTVVEMAAGGVSPAARGSTPEEEALAARVGEFLDDPESLADDTLTLTRVARRIGAPARSVSVAVNRVTGGSFSDLLNDRRVARSVHLMEEDPERALLDIMLAAGYATKSNFYKQFKRRKGRAPAAFRAAGRKRPPTPAEPRT